ncbi:hypothetical protein BC826DRAFT_1049831 [Russula brevipes]|nr:hypothetical protein BC826DRAFT_1049831 [Russula brevipes]
MDSDSDSETTLQVNNQSGCRPPFLLASRSSSNTSSAESLPFGFGLGFSFFQSPVHRPHLEMYASPPPLVHSQSHHNLSPALAASPHLFTPPVPFRCALSPGLSPIDRSPRPPRPESSLPPSSIHLGCTSTPVRATPRPTSSPFSSPLSVASSVDVPLSCVPAPHHCPEASSTKNRSASGIPPPLTVTLKRPTTAHSPTSRENKRPKATTPSSPSSPPVLSSIRTFPPSIPIRRDFPGFYIRFPVIPPVLKAPSGCILNPSRDVFDLYTPRLVRGSGHTKVGLCPLCACTGMGKVWLSMKFSAYKCYHMQYFHGIAASTARPFSPPTAFRTVPRQRPGKLERTQMLEGRCHRCMRWVPVQGVKDADAKVKELFWWKHAATCHGTSTIPGERNIFISDPDN